MKENKHFKNVSLILFSVLILMILSGFLFAMLKTENSRTKITVAVPQNGYVQNYDTNYYSEWLREKTGYDIEFVPIADGYEEEYLSTMLLSKEGRVDAVFLPREKDYVSRETITSFAKEGLIEDLTEYAVAGTQMRHVLDETEGTEILNGELSDKLFFVPNVDAGKKQSNMQILWINIGWLKKLSLQIPETTEDLETVLLAFKNMDPNGNGKQDEIPLISNNTDESYQSFFFLLNAFSYIDPIKNHIIDNGVGLKTGLAYCRNLYEKGLISDVCNDYSLKQVKELVNAPDNLVGAFTSKSIEDIVYPNCEDVLARFIQVPPLKGPNGEQNAISLETEALIGGFIPANAKHKREAFEVMDLMLSIDGSLISGFGEENRDWRYAEKGELSGYGTKAGITTLNYLPGKIQNKNFAGAGPMYLPKDISNAVAWNGANAFVEYLDARAIRVYENYYRLEELQTEFNPDNSQSTDLHELETAGIQDFIFGSSK